MNEEKHMKKEQGFVEIFLGILAIFCGVCFLLVIINLAYRVGGFHENPNTKIMKVLESHE